MDEDAARLDTLYSEIERTAREIAVLQAKQVRFLVEYSTLYERVCTLFPDFVTDDIALALRSTLNMANRRLTLAQTLVTRLPGTLAAMEAGDLDLPRAEAIAEATRPLSDQVAGQVEDHVLAGAVEQNPSQVRRAVAKAVLRLDPEGAEQRHARRREDRYVEILPAPEGMADLYALLPAEDAMRIKVRLDAYAKAQPKTDPRTMDQRRADAMTDLLLTRTAGPITATVRLTAPATLLAAATQTALHTSGRGSRPAGKPRSTKRHHTAASAAPAPATPIPGAPIPGAPIPTAAIPGAPIPTAAIPTAAIPTAPLPTVPVSAVPLPTVPVSAVPLPAAPIPAAPIPAASGSGTPSPTTPLPATTDHPADGSGTYPAELTGYGVITGSQAITLAAHDATWRRLLTDPATGNLTDVSRHQYTPPAALADYVRARDQYCVFPGCSVPAERCDLDHRVPFPRGLTDAQNLAALCRHHHRLKHQTGWTMRRRADGTHVWTSPQERDYLNPPIPLAPPEPPPPPPAPPAPPPPPRVVADDPPPF